MIWAAQQNPMDVVNVNIIMLTLMQAGFWSFGSVSQGFGVWTFLVPGESLRGESLINFRWGVWGEALRPFPGIQVRASGGRAKPPLSGVQVGVSLPSRKFRRGLGG